MIAGFTGTQDGMTKSQVHAYVTVLNNTVEELHHGDCIGADKEAHEWALSFDVPTIVIHPPIILSKRALCHNIPSGDTLISVLPPKEYLSRNRDIVDACDLLIAAPKTYEEEQRSGTWATVRYARKRGTPIIILHP